VTASISFRRPPRSILIVSTRRLGDVLLVTPLVRSFKAHWPNVDIDVLVFRGTEGVLENNPDIRRVIAVEPRGALRTRIADALRLWRRYDLACSMISSDRAQSYAWFAGRRRIGLVEPERITRLARFFLQSIALDQHRLVHVVTSNLALAALVGAPRVAKVVAPSAGTDPARRARFEARFAGLPPAQPLAVVHPYPMYAYKQWRIEGWAQTIVWLRAQGFAVALSGGPAQAERDYADAVAAAAGEPVLNFVGQLSFGETADMIRRAKLFIGPDTGATHVAAATGTPTLALFGPSNPTRWGPWPNDWPAGDEPWALRGSAQRSNVYLLQGEGACVPCKLEGCERNVNSYSACLTEMDAGRVIAAAAQLLGLPPPAQSIDISALTRGAG
jgi:heptosyltransferase-3